MLIYTSWFCLGFPSGSDGKESLCSARDPGLIPGLGRFPGEGNGTHSSILACIVHGITKSQTRLSDFHFHKDFLALRQKNQRYKLVGGMWQKFRWSHIFLHSKFLGQKKQKPVFSCYIALPDWNTVFTGSIPLKVQDQVRMPTTINITVPFFSEETPVI